MPETNWPVLTSMTWSAESALRRSERLSPLASEFARATTIDLMSRKARTVLRFEARAAWARANSVCQRASLT